MARNSRTTRAPARQGDLVAGSAPLRQALFTAAVKLGRTKLWMALLVFTVFLRQGVDHLAEATTPAFWFFVLATAGPVAYILAQAHVDARRLQAKAEVLKARERGAGGRK